MAFSLRLRRHPKPEIDRRVKDAAKILGIGDLLDRRPDKLSGGQRQRVALGRAIVRKPDLFLFDEPLSNLDAKLRVHMRMELIKLHKRLQKTMIYVTHDQVEAMTMGDRIVVMKDARIHQVGTPEAVFHEPKNLFVAGFIGSPTMNFIECDLIQENSNLYFVTTGIKLKLPRQKAATFQNHTGRKLILGIRPEYLNDSRLSSKAVDENSIRTVVDVIEPLGSEIICYLNAEDESIVCRLDADIKLKPGQVFEAVVDMSKIHVFDLESGESIA
jgi:multiple sugar transport system ATP-binding protein